MRRGATRLLLVEGEEDKRVIPWLIESTGIEWGPSNSPIVNIVCSDGVDELLSPGFIETHLKSSGLSSLGVIVDANDSLENRWARIKARISHRFPEAPDRIPETGAVLNGEDDPVFGAWIMPDNISRGMLETFLMFLRPEDNQPLLDLADKVVSEAKDLGAPFSSKHVDKSRIHSWLAWQDPPGRQLHNAIMEKILSHRPPCLNSFVNWFKRLYGLT